jgi:hypothetical protein
MKRNLIDRSAGKQFTGLFSFPPHPWRKKPSPFLPAKAFKFSDHIFIGVAVARVVDGGIPIARKPPCQRRKADTEIFSNLPSCAATHFGKPNGLTFKFFVNSGRFVMLVSFQFKKTSPLLRSKSKSTI